MRRRNRWQLVVGSWARLVAGLRQIDIMRVAGTEPIRARDDIADIDANTELACGHATLDTDRAAAPFFLGSQRAARRRYL
jgi:hypothetical protein